MSMRPREAPTFGKQGTNNFMRYIQWSRESGSLVPFTQRMESKHPPQVRKGKGHRLISSRYTVVHQRKHTGSN